MSAEEHSSVKEQEQKGKDLFARRSAARCMLGLPESELTLSPAFFDCLQWIAGADAFAAAMVGAASRISGRGSRSAKKALEEALQSPEGLSPPLCAKLARAHACLRELFREEATEICTVFLFAPAVGRALTPPHLDRARKRYGLDQTLLRLSSFIFTLEHCREAAAFFEEELTLHNLPKMAVLAQALDLTRGDFAEKMGELAGLGFLVSRPGFPFRLSNEASFAVSGKKMEGENYVLDVPKLPLRLFSASAEEVEHVRLLLSSRESSPVHILLHGPAGRDRLCFARSMAEACGTKALSVSRCSAEAGSRQAALHACMDMAEDSKGTFVVVEEADGLLASASPVVKSEDRDWLSGVLLRPEQRVIWVCDSLENIPQSVLRLFSYSLSLEEFGIEERVEAWRSILKEQGLSRRFSTAVMTSFTLESPVDAIAMRDAVKQAFGLYPGRRDFWQALGRILRSKNRLQNGGKSVVKGLDGPCREFTQNGVCMEGDIVSFLARCRRLDDAIRSGTLLRPGCGTMLFYGPPGTGKSELARFIADAVGRECLVKRASSLLSHYVGQGEQNVAAAFQEAEQKGAVLVIDEADSFLFPRERTREPWEATLVNEFLTSLESFRGFCICTTNRRKDMDSAAMRRFSYKIRFRYADTVQVQALYEALLAPLCKGRLSSALRCRLKGMDRLTPGDFHSVRARYDPLFSDNEGLTHAMLVEELAKEVEMKTESGGRRIGFVT